MKLIKAHELQLGDEFVKAVSQNRFLYGKVLGLPNSRRKSIVYSYYKDKPSYPNTYFNEYTTQHNNKRYLESSVWEEILLIKRNGHDI